MINIFFITIVTNCLIFSYGLYLYLYIFKEKLSKYNIYEIPIFGIIILSFISLLINFFFPINKLVGSIILILGLIFLIVHIFENKLILIKLFKLIIISSLISTLLLSYSHIYRPDGGLYHLPFISIINENKIIFGLTNIHFRFGHTSIIQYLSALQNNYFFNIASLSIPIASIFSFSILYIIKKIFETNQEKSFFSIFCLFIAISCIISYGSFGNYGNDAASNIYFFLLIIFFLQYLSNIKEKDSDFFKILFISIFLFTTKAFMSLALLIPIIIFFLKKNKIKIFKNISFYLSFAIIISWFIKSIIISGCLIYPIKESCLSNLKYHDVKQTLAESSAGEAWAKDWVNQKDVKLNYIEYNKEFKWLKTWSSNHLLKILEKLLPLLIFIILFTLYYFFKKKNKYKISKGFGYILFFSFALSIIWFLKFPLYRYGSSFLIVFIISLSIFFMNNFGILPKRDQIKKNFNVILIIFVFGFISKNFLRIHENMNILKFNVWPDIYSEDNSGIENKFSQKKKSNTILYYYSNGKLCMYSKSPCSNYNVKNLNKEYIGNYILYFKD